MPSRVTRFIGLVALLLAIGGARLRAQAPHDSTARPHVALVLSGGSAKGFAQIGVLHVVEDLGIPVDMVVGTSMGAIIGGLYAVGYTPDDLEHLARTEDWSNFFTRPTNRRDEVLADKDEDARYVLTFPINRGIPGLPRGVISRQGIAEHIERFTWPASGTTDFRKLPTPYAALVTDLATGNPILLQGGSVAQAMEASAAVPGAFAPVRLSDGRYAVDGAVVRNIPASDARSLGADILICVDVSEQIAPVQSLHSLIDIVDQTVSFRVQASNAVELPLCNVVITPDINGIPSVAFGLATEWISRGRTAAEARRSELTAIADSIHRLRGVVPARAPLPRVDSVFIQHVRWTDVSTGTDRIVRGTHELRDETWMSLADIESAVGRLYATGRFDQVSFRVIPAGGAHDLMFDLTEGDRDVLGVGVRYDTPEGVALLASASVDDWLSPGSTASVSARLGSDQQLDARDVLGAGPNAHFTQTYRATFSRIGLPRFRSATGQKEPLLDVREVAGEIDRRLSPSAAAGIELAHAWSEDGAPDADPEWQLQRQSFTTLAGNVHVDTYDKSVAATRGYSVFWRSEVAVHDRGAASAFSRQVLDAQGVYSFGSVLTALARIDAGYASGADVPDHKKFLIGGSVPSAVWPTQFIPFLGLPPQSRVGTAIQVLGGGLQARLPDQIVATVRGNIGNVFDSWPRGVHRNGYEAGGGITLSTVLPPGPLSLTVASRGVRLDPIIEISFGSLF